MMSEQAAPAPHADGTEGRHSAAPGTGTSAAPVPGGTVPGSAALVRMSAAERAAGVVVKAAQELWLHPDRLLHSFVRPEPETMKEHWAHVQSRAWVPGEMTGTPEKVVTALGLFHHLLVAYPVKAAAKAAKFTAGKVDEAADRPLRLYGLVIFVALILVLLFVL